MIEYLEKLVEDREYKKALDYAEKLMLNPDNSPVDLLAINSALLCARLYTGECHGAIVVGQVALKLGAELKEWDYYGTACLDLAASYMTLSQYEAAIEVLNCYLMHVQFYTKSARLEATVRYNLGISYRSIGDLHNALKAIQGAIRVAEDMGNHRYANGIRQALTELYLLSGQLGPVPNLLAKCAHYLRHHDNAYMIKESRLYHVKLRAEFALATQRPLRAQMVAISGLHHAGGLLSHHADCHMLLARTARQFGTSTEALGHVLAARIYAMHCRRHDIESEALAFAYDLTRDYPHVVADMDGFYLSQGIDLV